MRGGLFGMVLEYRGLAAAHRISKSVVCACQISVQVLVRDSAISSHNSLINVAYRRNYCWVHRCTRRYLLGLFLSPFALSCTPRVLTAIVSFELVIFSKVELYISRRQRVHRTHIVLMFYLKAFLWCMQRGCSFNKLSHFRINVRLRVWHNQGLFHLFWQHHVDTSNLVLAVGGVLDVLRFCFGLSFVLFLKQTVACHGLLLVLLHRVVCFPDFLLLFSRSLKHILQSCNMLQPFC